MSSEIDWLPNPAADRVLDTKGIEAFLVGIAVCAYLLVYPPFVFTWFVPDTFRIMLELLIVFPMLAGQMIAPKKSKIILVFLALGLVKVVFFPADEQTIFGRFDKIVFAVCFVEAMHRNGLLFGFVHRMLEFFLVLTSIQVIASSLLWFSFPGLFVFDRFNVSLHSNYAYFGNILLGNLTHRSFGYLDVARPMGYFTEPGLAASVLVMYSFAHAPAALSKPLRLFRQVLFAGAAIATGSITAVGLLGARVVLRIVRKPVVAIGIVLSGVLVVFFAYQALSTFIPSGESRVGRMQDVVATLKSASPLDLLIGREVGAGGTVSAINAGIGILIVEYGLIAAFFLLNFLRKICIRLDVFVVLLLMNLAFDFFWWPIFWVIAAVLHEGRWEDVRPA
jgi:hypothetical protein